MDSTGKLSEIGKREGEEGRRGEERNAEQDCERKNKELEERKELVRQEGRKEKGKVKEEWIEGGC